MSFSQIRQRYDDRYAGFKTAVRMSLKGVSDAIASSGGSSMGTLESGDEKRNMRQYEAAMQGIPYTAIRPAAIKIAGQPIHVGFKRSELEMQQVIQKSLARKTDLCLRSPVWLKNQAKNVEVVDSHPLLSAFSDPNPLMTSWALKWCTVFSIYATGRAFWVLDQMQPDEFYPEGKLEIYYVPATWMKQDELGRWKIQRMSEFGYEGTRDSDPIPDSNVIQFSMPDPSDPSKSHSPLSAQAKAVNVDDDIQTAHEASMKNGIHPGVVIKAGRLPDSSGAPNGPRPNLTPEQRSDLVSAIKLAYQGVWRHGEPFIVDGMIEDVMPWTRSPTEMDFMNSAKLTEARIMKGIGTNPIVAGEIEGANRASAYVAHEGFYEINVNPISQLISETMTRKFRSFYGSAIRVWVEESKAHDRDLMDRRFSLAVQTGGVVTRGETRRWVMTGEIDLQDREDDDELVGESLEPEGEPKTTEPEQAA